MCASRASASTSSGWAYSRSIRSRTRRRRARSLRCWAAASLLVTARSWHIRSRSPQGPRSAADVGREVLAGDGGAGGDELGGRALEDDPAAVVAGAGAEIDDPVGVRHHSLVMGYDDDRFPGVDEPVEQGEQLPGGGQVQGRGGLVEGGGAALFGHLGGQVSPLPFAPGQRGEGL